MRLGALAGVLLGASAAFAGSAFVPLEQRVVYYNPSSHRLSVNLVGHELTRTINCTLPDYEWVFRKKTGITAESVRDAYVRPFFDMLIPKQAKIKYDWAVRSEVRQKVNDFAKQVGKTATQPYVILSLMINESGLNLLPETYYNCYGMLQLHPESVRDAVSDASDYIKTAKSERERIVWKRAMELDIDKVLGNDFTSQIHACEAYLMWLERNLNRRANGRIKENDMQNFVVLAYNMGLDPVAAPIENTTGEIDWDTMYPRICSYTNIDLTLGNVIREADIPRPYTHSVLRKKAHGMIYSARFNYNLERLKLDFPRLKKAA